MEIMARKKVPIDVIRSLLARSGNKCAFPGCTHPVVNEINKLVAEICHIEAAEEGGPRYNLNQSDYERRGYDNLIILCRRHHLETHYVNLYSVERLRKMKYDHESQFAENPFKVDESLIYKIQAEMEHYWDVVERLHNTAHQCADLKIEVDTKASFDDITDEINKLLGSLEEVCKAIKDSNKSLVTEISVYLEQLGVDKSVINLIPIDSNPFEFRNWEYHHIGVPNHVNKIKIRLMQLEIKYLEEFLKINPGDLAAHNRLKTFKARFIEKAQNAVHVD